MIDPVIARLEAQVPELSGRVDGGRAFLDLIRANKLPGHSLACYVFPAGIQGGKADAMAGAFTQILRYRVSVVLFLRTTGQTGKRALDRIDAFLMQVIHAVAGWAPSDEVGVFELTAANPVDIGAGRMAWQLDFNINDELRIFS